MIFYKAPLAYHTLEVLFNGNNEKSIQKGNDTLACIVLVNKQITVTSSRIYANLLRFYSSNTICTI